MNIGAYYNKARLICIKWLTTIYNKFLFYVNGVNFGEKVTTCGVVYVRNAGSITIGNNVNINSMISSNPIGGSKTILFTCLGANIFIGSNVGLSNSILYARQSIIIEDYVVIGAGTKIFDTDFHSVVPEYRLHGNTDVPVSPVILKEKCFVGTDCIILKGVTIGKGSVIGAGSIVTKNVPDNQIWAGNPARFIKLVTSRV